MVSWNFGNRNVPRERLIHFRTPLVRAKALGKMLGFKDFLIKRDDLTGQALGGNKFRQMEFYLAEALEKKATCLLSTGAVQSNFVLAGSAVAAANGLKFFCNHEQRVPNDSELYQTSGNVFLTNLFGGNVNRLEKFGDDEEKADLKLNEMEELLIKSGEKPYTIFMSPDRHPIGALGYVKAAKEFLQQCKQMQINPSIIAVASGSGLTHAGLLYGLRAQGSKIKVYGYCIRRKVSQQRERLLKILSFLNQLSGLELKFTTKDIILSDEGLGSGYGQEDRKIRETIIEVAKTEGLLLDPVYTGKAFWGLKNDIFSEKIGKEEFICFWHTGGTAALFAYQENFWAHELGISASSRTNKANEILIFDQLKTQIKNKTQGTLA